MKRGLVIGRFQPYHIGHHSVIEKMENDSEIDEIIIGIGTAQIGNTQINPLTSDERETMLERSICIQKPYHLVKINDINDDGRWVSHVESLCPDFDIVYTGNSWVKRLFEEKEYRVKDVEFTHDISATDLRELILKEGQWQIYLPKETAEFLEEIEFAQRVRKLEQKYLKPSVTADVIINYKDEGIVLVRRKREPFKDFWAIPGGFLNKGRESVEEAAVREIKEETDLEIDKDALELLGIYSEPQRDPRDHTVSVVYYANVESGNIKGGDDALEARVFNKIPEKLAFDHSKMLGDYYEKIKKRDY